MIADLSEQDRRKVGAGIMLLSNHKNSKDITLGNIYTAQVDGNYLVSSNNGNIFASRSQLLGQMIVKSDGRLNDKYAKDLIKFYEQSIEVASDNDIVNSNKLLEVIAQEENGIAKSLANYTNRKSSLEAKHEKLKKEGEIYLHKVKFTDFSVTKNRSSFKIESRVSFMIKNQEKVALKYPSIGIEIRLKNNQKLLLSNLYSHHSNKATDPGEQRIYDNFWIRKHLRMKDKNIELPNNIEEYDITTYLAKIKFSDGTKKVFRLEGGERRFLYKKGYEKHIKACAKAQAQLDDFRKKIQLRIGKLKNRQIKKLDRISRFGNYKC